MLVRHWQFSYENRGVGYKHMFNKICEGTEGHQLRCVVYGKGGSKTMKNCMKINI